MAAGSAAVGPAAHAVKARPKANFQPRQRLAVNNAHASVSLPSLPPVAGALVGPAGAAKGHEGKCGEGKCGGDKAKGEGKCGGDKAKGEGKCGEGKCGEGKCGADKGKEGEGDDRKAT